MHSNDGSLFFGPLVILVLPSDSERSIRDLFSMKNQSLLENGNPNREKIALCNQGNQINSRAISRNFSLYAGSKRREGK